MALRTQLTYSEKDYAKFPTKEDLLKAYKSYLEDEAGEIKKEYEAIVSKFKSKKSRRVKFVVASARIGKLNSDKYSGKAIFAAAGTNAYRTPIVWLDEGTRWRARRMSPDWKSKTRPGSLSVGAGKGYARKGKNAWGRFPGIEARLFRVSIIKKRERAFRKGAEPIFERMIKGLGW